MSSHVPTPTLTPIPLQPSTSSSAYAMTPAAGGQGSVIRPTPNAIPPFHRIDTHQIKQQLHDALGEAGLPYWKALNGYLLGQVGKDELTALVRSWLKGAKNLQLHNQLLYSLLHNASSPLISHAPSSPLNGLHKGRRGGIDAPDFDSDLTFIEPKERVHHWVLGMGGKERSRVRRAVLGHEGDDEPPIDVVNERDMDEDGGRKRKWSAYTSDPAYPPLAQGARVLPSSHQLGMRMSQVAKGWNLDVPVDESREVGEFMGVGLNAHMSDILHAVVHLTGHDRPGSDTMRVPQGAKRVKHHHPNGVPDGMNGSAKTEAQGEVPTPSLSTLQYLFTLAPGLHPQASPTLYKLESSFTGSEVAYATPPDLERRRERERSVVAIGAELLPSAAGNGPVSAAAPQPLGAVLNQTPSTTAAAAAISAAAAASPRKAATTIHTAAGQGKLDTVSQTLVSTGLLKIDKAGRGDEPEGEKKREKKHNLHWKYEDPAIILKDVLG